jgi:hypothetical protein
MAWLGAALPVLMVWALAVNWRGSRCRWTSACPSLMGQSAGASASASISLMALPVFAATLCGPEGAGAYATGVGGCGRRCAGRWRREPRSMRCTAHGADRAVPCRLVCEPASRMPVLCWGPCSGRACCAGRGLGALRRTQLINDRSSSRSRRCGAPFREIKKERSGGHSRKGVPRRRDRTLEQPWNSALNERPQRTRLSASCCRRSRPARPARSPCPPTCPWCGPPTWPWSALGRRAWRRAGRWCRTACR